MERLELAPLYDVVKKVSKGIFPGANGFEALGRRFLRVEALWLWHPPYPFDVFHRAVVFGDVLRPLSHVP